MNHKYYQTTALEDWVTAFYKKLNILHPSEIDIEVIARYYCVFIHRKPRCPSHEILGRYRGIVIDSREDVTIQKEMFFHELCHILRHCGVQSMMPEAFRQLQEWDATHFVKYACIPHHMIKYIPFDEPFLVEETARLFNVSYELSDIRMKMIYNRIEVDRYQLLNIK